MALLKILEVPNPLLKKKSEKIETLTDDLRETLDDMLETMYAAPGVGLAAPQVGLLKRMVVIDVTRDDEPKKPYKMINPVITAHSEKPSRTTKAACRFPNSTPLSNGLKQLPSNTRTKTAKNKRCTRTGCCRSAFSTNWNIWTENCSLTICPKSNAISLSAALKKNAAGNPIPKNENPETVRHGHLADIALFNPRFNCDGTAF